VVVIGECAEVDVGGELHGADERSVDVQPRRPVGIGAAGGVVVVVGADDVILPVGGGRPRDADFKRDVVLMHLGGDAAVESAVIGRDVEVVRGVRAVGRVLAVVRRAEVDDPLPGAVRRDGGPQFKGHGAIGGGGRRDDVVRQIDV